VAGEIIEMRVNAGDRVTAGELVAKLDSSDALSQLNQAEANLSAVKARYDQSAVGVSLKDAQTKTAIDTARANLSSAQAHLQQMITSAKIEDEQADSGVKQADANLSSAQQNLSQLKEGARTQERAQAHFGVERAQADYNHAVDNFNRMETLFKEGAVSQQSRDDARYSMQVYQTALENSKQQASLVEAGSRSQQVAMAEEQVRQSKAALELAKSQVQRKAMSHDDVRQAEEQVRQMEAQLAAAQAGTAQYAMTRKDVAAAAAEVGQAAAQVQFARQQLDNTRIYSPISGIVDTRPANTGSSIAPTTVLMTILPSRGLYFEAEVPEDAIASVHVGDFVNTTVDALPGHTFPGRIAQVIPVADTGTKLYRVHISIPDSSASLPQNAFARGAIITGQIHGVTIPRDAIATNVGDSYVYVVANGQAHRRFVKIGATDDTRAQILSGLNAGEQYVTSGQEGITDGAPVTIRPDVRAGVKQ
jgi:multidrug resistance efflux pump